MESYNSIYERVCRVCMKPSKHKMVCLLDRTADDGLSCYGKSFKIFSNCDIKFNKELPTKLCRKCLHLLRNSIKLKLTCEQSDKHIERLLKFHSVTDYSFKKTFVEYCLYINNFVTPNFDNTKKNINKDKTIANISDSKIKYEISIDLFKHEISDNNDNDLDINSDLHDTKVKKENLVDMTDTYDDKKYIHDGDFDVNDYWHNANYYGNKCISDDDESMMTYDDNKEINYDGDEEIDVLFDLMEKEVYDGEYIDIDIKETVNHENNVKDNSVEETKSQGSPKKNPKRELPKNNTTCDICQKVYCSPTAMRSHRNRHGIFNFMCEICGQAYPTNDQLIMHQSTRHDIGNTLFCQNCSFKTTTKKLLTEHIRIHTGERPFACEKCGLTFRRDYVYKKHLIRHSDKTIQCPHCPARFYYKYAMTDHCNNIHDRKYMYKCTICTAMYARTGSLRSHYISQHNIPKEQQIIEKTYQNLEPSARSRNRKRRHNKIDNNEDKC